MKKLTLRILLCSLLVISAMLTFAQEMSQMPAQNIEYMTGGQETPKESVKSFFTEDFSAGLCPPANWDVTPTGTANWVISTGDPYAGGEAPEGKLYYFPITTNMDTRMICPVINTSAYTALELEFKHALSGASNTNYSFSIETSSDGGTTWNEVWSITPGGSFDPETVTIPIENDDVGSPNFQFCFAYDGPPSGYGVYNYYFDDIVLTALGGTEVYTVTYNVKDEDENPIEDAEIAMGAYGTLSTDASGQAIFADVAPGTYTWNVTAGGFVEQSGIVTVTDADVIVDVELEYPLFPFTEDFSDNTMPPAGWTIEGSGEENWDTMNSSIAGGTAPEAAFAGSPNFNGISKLVSPVLSSSGISSLMLDFKHYLDDLAGSGYSCKVETTSDGGTTWNEVWLISPTGNIGPEDVSILIENDDVGSENFQFAFTFDGNTTQINYWYIDDISIAVPLPPVLLWEDFSSGEFSSGWSVGVGGGVANWDVHELWSNSEGVAPEAAFSWGPTYFSGNSKLVTPEINTWGYSSLLLEIKHYLWDNAGNGYSLKVETTSDGGTTWNEIWSVSPIGDIGPETLTLLIDNDDVGSDDFQFALTFDGYSGQLNHYMFDDILLSNGTGSTTYSVTYVVKDDYANPIEGAEVYLQNGGTKITDASGEVDFENVFPGTYTWYVDAANFAPESGEVTVTDSDVSVDVEMGIAVELLNETFEGSFPPLGWTKSGDAQSSWNKAYTANAGSEYPEVVFLPSTTFTGNSKLITPEIVTSAYTALFLEFKQNIMDLAGSGYMLKVESTSDGGTTWNEVWSVSPTGNIGPEFLELIIENDDVGSDIFQIAFTFDGNSAQIEKWYFDDVIVTGALNYDAGVLSVNMPSLVIVGENVDPAATVSNEGSETVTFDVTFEIIDGTAVYSEMITVTDLDPLGEEMLTFPTWITVLGSYVVEVTVDLVGDENPNNDMLNQKLDVADDLLARKPLYEVFTSSTCPPCPAANEVIDSILGANPDEYTLIKYQMNWPGAGDLYYTEEGGVRRDYYAVASVPDLYINSDQISPAASLTLAIFDKYALEETALEIDITEASIDDDNIITVSADLTSIINYDEGLTAHIVVVEKLTTGNVGTNGETEFHHVMMKMLPDASGTSLDALSIGVPVTLSESFDMDETNIEEPDDLAVIVLVQDDIDKSVVQSEMLDVNTWTSQYCNAITLNENEHIANVLCGDIDNSSGWQGSIADYTDQSTTIPSGGSEDIVITNGNPYAVDEVHAWVDWNMDYEFGIGGDEEFVLTNDGTGTTFTGAITVPIGAPEGDYRMRIRMVYNNSPEPCGESNYGEIEDYTLNILNNEILMDLKVLLEGSFNKTAMYTGLIEIPLYQPYNVSPWEYAGTESVISIPDPNVVDWVLVELREAANAASATSATIIGRQAAFVLNDGTIVDIDGVSNLIYTHDITQQLFVVIYHRNHVAVMSNDPLVGVNGIYTIDFSSGQDQVYGGITGHKEITTGIWGMVCGDGDANNDVDIVDKMNIWMIQAGLQGYLQGDFNMDGNINNQDKDDSWLPNEGFVGQVPD